MPLIKTEESNARLSVLGSSSIASNPLHYSNDTQHKRQSNSVMNAHSNLPAGALPPHQEPMYTHAAVIEAITYASHGTLLRAGNSAYQAALNEAAEKRAVAQRYHQQLIELTNSRIERNAYTQVSVQQRDQNVQAQPQLTQQAQSENTSLTIAAPSVSPITVPTPPVETYGPLYQPGGLKLVSRTNDGHTSPPERPPDLPPQVFWLKSDWPGIKMTFITDRQGTHLKHLVSGIRRAARQIWTELDKTPGCCTGRTFLKNGIASPFMDEYIGTIEAIYPCLKLCSGHWKALQVGMLVYPHWYRSRRVVRPQEF